MEELLSYHFGSVSIMVFTFFGLTFVGFGLGFGFWLDFRRRSSKDWHIAGWIVLFAGLLIGAFFGYQATQPESFKKLTANHDGIRLEYYMFTEDVLLGWNDIESILIKNNRLIINKKQGGSHVSPVVYRGDQAQLMQSINILMPGNDPQVQRRRM